MPVRPVLVTHSILGSRLLVRPAFEFRVTLYGELIDVAQLNVFEAVQPRYAGHASIFGTTFAASELPMQMRELQTRPNGLDTSQSADECE